MNNPTFTQGTLIPLELSPRHVAFQGVLIHFLDKDMISLTDTWKAAGSPKNKDPRQWTRFEGKEFISSVAKKLNVSIAHIVKSARGGAGGGGGTWAHWQIWLAYAKYLSPELHMWANQVVKERIEEEANPELAVRRGHERGIRGWRRQGRDDKWIALRLQGMAQRDLFTNSLVEHGVTRESNFNGFAACTEKIQEPILGQPTRLAKIERGLKPRDSIRERASNVELAAFSLAEALAVEKMDTLNLYGNKPCIQACADAGNTIAKAIQETRRITNS